MGLLYGVGLAIAAITQGWGAHCEAYLNHMERAMGIPPHLLRAISHIESGRQVQGARVAWPWTINVSGRGYIFATKQEAIAAVKRFQKQGAHSIDVGCMQVNLKYHPHAFRSLEDAFDPQLNIMYAAQYLKNLKARYGTWMKAVGHYHSALPDYHGPYRQRVMQVWAGLRQPSRRGLGGIDWGVEAREIRRRRVGGGLRGDALQHGEASPMASGAENELPPMVVAPEREAALSLVRFTPYIKEPSTQALHQSETSPMASGAENGQGEAGLAGGDHRAALPLARRVGEQPTAHVKRHYVKLFVTRDTASTLGFS